MELMQRLSWALSWTKGPLAVLTPPVAREQIPANALNNLQLLRLQERHSPQSTRQNPESLLGLWVLLASATGTLLTH